MLTKQSQVLTNLGKLDEEEAERAHRAELKWQVGFHDGQHHLHALQ